MTPNKPSPLYLSDEKPLAKSDGKARLSRRKQTFHHFHMAFYFIQKLRLVYKVQSTVSATIVFAGFFSVLYEFDQLRDDKVNMFMSLTVSVMTMIYLAMHWMEVRTDLITQKLQTNFLAKETEGFSWPWLQTVALAIHPNYLFYRSRILDERFSHSYHRQFSFQRNFNDYLFLFQCTVQLLMVVNNQLRLSMFAQPRTERLSRLFNLSYNRSYVIKCLLKNDTLFFLASFLVSMAFYFTLIFCVTEAPITIHPEKHNLGFQMTHSFLEAWYFSWTCLMIFGYGDKVPQTHLGRVFAMFASIIGACALPFVTIAVYQFVQLSQVEKQALACSKKQRLMVLKERIVSIASGILHLTKLQKFFEEERPSFVEGCKKIPVESELNMRYLREGLKATESKIWSLEKEEEHSIPDLLQFLTDQLHNEVDQAVVRDRKADGQLSHDGIVDGVNVGARQLKRSC
jgi:hypothetical protein